MECRVMEGKPKRESKLNWPKQGELTDRDWKVWKAFLEAFTEHGTRKLKEEFKMGDWTDSHQK